MKSLVVLILFSCSFAAAAKPLTAMGLVEKASYQIGGQVAQGKLPPIFLTDITTVKISVLGSGYSVQMFAPSASGATPNEFDVAFTNLGVFSESKFSFTSAAVGSPLFKGVSVAVYLDKLAENFVDHLSGNALNLEVAQKVISIQLTPSPQGAMADILLNDNRIYHVQMDFSAKVITGGF